MQFGYGLQWFRQDVALTVDPGNAFYDAYHAPDSLGHLFDIRLGDYAGLKHWEVTMSYPGYGLFGIRRQWLNPGRPQAWASTLGLELGLAEGNRGIASLTAALSSPLADWNWDSGFRVGRQSGPSRRELELKGSVYGPWFPPESTFVDLYSALRLAWGTSELSLGAWARWQWPERFEYVYSRITYQEVHGASLGVALRYGFARLRVAPQPAGPGRARLPEPGRSPLKKDVSGHLQLGQDLLLGKFYADAAAEFQAVLDHEPEHATALKALGYLYYVQGDWPQALTYYRRAAQADPQDTVLLLWLKQLEASQAGPPAHLPGAPQ